MEPMPAGEPRRSAAPATAGSWQIGSLPDGWWARERAEFLREQIEPIVVGAGRVLDSGCGTGGFALDISRSGAGFAVACDFALFDEWVNEPGRLAHVVCDAGRLPFRDGAFDVSVALDVIEHCPDEHAPLAELGRVTATDGHVGVTVPAFQELWSPFDVSVGHHRRYRDRDLARACVQADLRPLSSTYFFAWLVPPAWLMRKRNRRNADHDRPGSSGRLIDHVVGVLGRAERAWLRGHRLPIGTSLWALSTVNGTPRP